MRITCILGSPRHDGNSAQLAACFMEKAVALGVEITKFELNKMSYSGCQGCCACKTKLDRCILKDDLTKVFADIEKADAIMLSAPVYFGDVPGQVKCFVDRLFNFFKPDYVRNPEPSRLAPGRKLVLILSQGAPETAFAQVAERYGGIMKRTLAVGDIRVIRAFSVGAGGIPREVPEKFLLQAEEIAEELMACSQ